MKATMEIDIFPDPEYCNDNDIEKCQFKQYDSYNSCEICVLCENKKLKKITKGEFDDNYWVKCDECKEVYNRKTPYIDPIYWFPKTMKSTEEFLRSIAHEMDEKERKAFIFGWQSSIRFQEDK